MKRIAILLFLFIMACNSQTKVVERTIQKKNELKPPFANQGEQEDYWAQEFFKKNYKYNEFSKFKGRINTPEQNIISFDDYNVILNSKRDHLRDLLTKRIIYPQLIFGYNKIPQKTKKVLDTLSIAQRYFYRLGRSENIAISDFEELDFLSNSPKVKRFRFWLFSGGSANPQVFLFELTNIKATEKTNWEHWIRNAKLTFFKGGWIII